MKYSLKFKIALFILIVSNSLLCFSKEKIILAADYWCPYNCNPKEPNEGFLVELARSAFEEYDIEVEYIVKPWNQCIEDFANKKIDGLVGVKKEEVKNAIYPGVEQALSILSAFTLVDTHWVYDGSNSLKGRVLGLNAGYDYPLDIQTYLYSNYLTKPFWFNFNESDNEVHAGILKLLSHQIFTYLDDENVVEYYLNQNNIKLVRNAGNVDQAPTKLYIAFNKDMAKAQFYADIIEQATLSLKSSPQYYNNLKKYSIDSFTNR